MLVGHVSVLVHNNSALMEDDPTATLPLKTVTVTAPPVDDGIPGPCDYTLPRIQPFPFPGQRSGPQVVGGTVIVFPIGVGGALATALEAEGIIDWIAISFTAMNVQQAARGPIVIDPEEAPKTAPVPEKPSLVDAKGQKHILEGDGPGKGGGHRPGTGKPGKSEFPEGWSDGKILGEVSDIATDPAIRWTRPDGRGYITGTKTVEGVDVKVVVDTVNGRIVTGFPTNLPRNP